MRRLIAGTAVAASVALPMSASAATAVWAGDVAGSVDDETKWVNGYKPQAGDTLDFSAVTATGMTNLSDYRAINGPSNETHYTTLTGLDHVYLGGTSDGDVAYWNVDYLEYENGHRFVVGSAAQLNVAGKITVKGSNRVIFNQGSRWIDADELELKNSMATMSYNACKLRLRRLTCTNRSGKTVYLSANNSGQKNQFVIGSGGVGFSGADSGTSFFVIASSRAIRFDPSADWTLGNGRTTDNLVLQLYSGGKQTLEIGTTDHYDATIPRTVTFEGGVGANMGLTDAKLVVDGIGTLVFNTVTSGHRFNSPITVKDTATLALRDTAVAPLGALNFASGTTLKVEQTSPSGIVELGGTVTLAANSTLEFDLAANSTTSALKVANLALPATGTVKVKLAESTAGRYTLAEGLPEGTTAANFTAVNDSGASTYLSLHVEGDKLVAVITRKATWKSNAGGDMSVASNWVDGYVPQAGDTLDFSVLSGSFKQIIEDFNDERSFETVIAPAFLYMGETVNDGHVGWGLKYLTYSSGVDFRVGTSGRLQVEGRITLTGSSTYLFNMFGSTTVVAGEIVNQGQSNYLVKYPNANASLRAEKFTHEGPGACYLTTLDDNNAMQHYIVGAGGIGFGGSASTARYWYCGINAGKSRTVRIDPSADYCLAANPSRADNMAISTSGDGDLSMYFGTTDVDDPSVARTVTFNGGLAGYQARHKVIFDGIGSVAFNATTNAQNQFPGTIQVKDSVKFILRDTASTAKGPMTFAAGTTLKVEQTRANGIVELGGALTLAANATLDFDLAENSATSALRVASLTMPASGKVRVKASGVNRGGRAVLIDNLPAGIRANQFEFVEKPYGNATLVVSGNKLMVEKSKGLVVIIAGGRTSSPAPVAAKILFAGDSTLDDYGRVANPYASWGTTLENFMRTGCSVDNYAKSGASTKSFRANGYWSSLLAAIRPGDFVGIQFGHNDQKAGTNFAAPDGLFRDNVRQFVADVRALGGKPILLSPIVRGTFDNDGNLYEEQLDNGTRLSQYATAMRELSVELGTDFVDMNALTHDLLVELGKAESAKLFAASAGKSGDYTHPIPAGADAFARLFVKNVKDRGLEVAALFS